MIRCIRCDKDKNPTDYHITAPTMAHLCKPCMEKIEEDND